MSKIPDDGKLHPAIIWITGGFGNGLDPVWEPADTENDQTASVFRKSGLITMYPSQRGGQMNPGHDESFLGEIDDIIAARDFLAKQKGIDSNRIYLGGHSTGGTKVLLVAEVTNKFRAVFSFAPVSYVVSYGPDALTYDFNNEDESLMRSPICWLIDIATPTYILEGNDPERSNIEELRRINKYVKKYELPLVHLFEIKNKDHFSSLYPASAILAKKILADTSANVNFEFNEELFGKVQMK
ncbi:prolyl oligopeptidase family serine peptidase [Chitinophaga sp. Cy-1792]|nr:prolyl oligopeptidase family serine peptidase [Chitinophaga sp. Cy-1792]